MLYSDGLHLPVHYLTQLCQAEQSCGLIYITARANSGLVRRNYNKKQSGVFRSNNITIRGIQEHSGDYITYITKIMHKSGVTQYYNPE